MTRVVRVSCVAWVASTPPDVGRVVVLVVVVVRCGSASSSSTVVLDLSRSPSFFISDTSDLKMRIDRPRLRAASGSRFHPKTMTITSTRMIRCQGSNALRIIGVDQPSSGSAYEGREVLVRHPTGVNPEDDQRR